MTIDWGYVYVATRDTGADLFFRNHGEKISLKMDLEDKKETFLILAYDDLYEKHLWWGSKNSVYAPFYTYPAGCDVYDMVYQMPVEECGNMLIMIAAVVRCHDGKQSPDRRDHCAHCPVTAKNHLFPLK